MERASALVPIAAITYVIIAVLILIEHQRLKDQPELIRRGVGATTILLPTLIPALLGFIDIWTWLYITLAYIVAGAVLALLVWQERDTRYQSTIKKLTDMLVEDDERQQKEQH
jgi:asparagine N-glycosylation enzyme membrane subunit Stt3